MRIAKECLPFVGALLALALALGFAIHPAAAAPPALLLLFTLWFFRDPERHPPSRPHALVSPADGRIVRVTAEAVSVFLNVFDVHICRAPMAGVVERVEYRPGRFLAAFRDEASVLNEQAEIVLVDGARRLGFTLVAGLIARRIVCKVAAGRQLRLGERVGLIRFGSRVDVALASGSRVAVRVGQRVVAGETVIATAAPASAVDQPPGGADTR